jgi:hypothetical protein
MGLKNILGTISPLYGAISGEGAMGKMLNPGEAKRIADEENARVMAAQASAEQAESNKQAAAGASQLSGMKKGGKVKSKSASSRADGIAQRGKTRGKMY